MFYNAIKRKGWEGAKEEDMPSTVAIHNAVNEHCWQKIMAWEKLFNRYGGRDTGALNSKGVVDVFFFLLSISF